MEIAHLIKCWLLRRKDLSSIPRTQVKKPGIGLKILSALSDDLGLIPSTHTAAHDRLTLPPGD